MYRPCSPWTNCAISFSLLDLRASLDDAVALALSNAYASSTHATRKSQAARYLQSCRLLQTSPLPISVNNLCRYCVFLGGTLKYSSILNYLDGLRWLHVMFDLPPPPLSHCRVQRTLRGLKRLLSASVQRKLPITPTILLALRDVMDFSLPLHRALWAAFLLGFFTFFSRFFASQILFLLVIRSSPRPSTFHAPTSTLPHGVSSSRSNGLKSFNSVNVLFSFR